MPRVSLSLMLARQLPKRYLSWNVLYQGQQVMFNTPRSFTFNKREIYIYGLAAVQY